MIQDLSHLMPGDGGADALVPSSQNSSDSRPHANRAMTAPGSPPADTVAEQTVPAPHVSAEVHEVSTVTHADRPILRRGGWNDLGGGPAPEGFRSHA